MNRSADPSDEPRVSAHSGAGSDKTSVDASVDDSLGKLVDESGAKPNDQTLPDDKAGTGLLAVVQSVGAAALGVQSRKNKERDFQQGNPMHFIVGGIIGTLIFIVAVWMLVQYLIYTT